MSTIPTGETRHRWTSKETARLAELAQPFRTLTEAADGTYVEMAMPRRAVYAKLYEQFLKGRVPHLSLTKERDQEVDFTAPFAAAVRELIRVMRVEGKTDVMVALKGERASISIQRKASSYEVEL